MLEKMFKLKQNGTNVRTEVVAGLTTFMTMAYITVSGIAIYDRLQLMYLRNTMKKEEY